MSDIDELQGRIAAALDRIGQGIDLRGKAGAADPEEVEALRQELEDERIANEQLKERIKVLKSRREALEAELATAQEAANAVVQLDSEMQGLREANDKLREINARLREANTAGVAEPDLINTAMLAELDGVRAARAADRAEAGAVYDALAAVIAGSEAGQGTVDEQPEGT